MSLKEFVSQDKDGKDVRLKFIKPNQKVLVDSDFIFKQYFSKCLRHGIITTAEATKLMKKNGLWDDEDDKNFGDLRELVKELESVFAKDELDKYTEDQLMEKAAKLKISRASLSELTQKISSIYDSTAESVANEYRLQYWASECVVYYDSGKKVFNSLDDFLSRTQEQIAKDAYLQALMHNIELNYGIDASAATSFPEDVWLEDVAKKEAEDKKQEVATEAAEPVPTKKVRRKKE